jgi:hypothetical protein
MSQLPPLPPLLRPSKVKATECLIDVHLAMLIRDKAAGLGLRAEHGGDLGFRCRECGQPVKPHAGNVPPHFEHVVGNPACSLSPGTS